MLKSVVIGLLLGGSILITGLTVKKMCLAPVFIIVVLFTTFFSFAAAFASYLVGIILLLFLNTGHNAKLGKTFYLTAMSGPLAGRNYLLSGKKDSLMIGREKSDVTFPRDIAGISRTHCTLNYWKGEVYLTDNNSQYGTYLLPSKQRLISGAPVKLEAGQQFCLAREDIVFKINLK